ncbi:Na+ dependent nucleoside transporter C-terminus-domain-containing protein [Cokeromyces recurvatus]|uniref:Na+ dependent nucleoside transporter C-terminus-domain-containing protein n=1 Tax=Cokeromyces recurvatus TaxID=90255 RepID=UPI0022200338|nr:Na+ dependent nucleoside transporter C-terminus-domain-containing protein [Cokeromyces recurvatus]KAI7898417.1 Na+ dependent nucleoside transporter C-terminus-domain-containing protein [Cokeromyces recurvatus]
MKNQINNEKTEKGLTTAIDIPTTAAITDNKSISIEISTDDEEETKKNSVFRQYYRRYRPFIHIAYFVIFTGFLAAAYALQVPKGYNKENLVLGLIYAFFCLKFLFKYVPTTIITRPFSWCVRKVGEPIMKLPYRIRIISYAIFVLAVIVVTVFSLPAKPESPRIQRLIGLFGMFVFMFVLWATSSNRRKVNWNTVLTGLLFQFILALFVFRCSVGQAIFQWASNFAQGYLGKASHGTSFVFGDKVADSGLFAVTVFPTVIFFAATVQVLYYFGALQFLLKKCAVFFMALLQVSGAESVVAVASPFLGQGENALLIKPFLPFLTNSEMHQIMCSGFATISGSVLYGYIAMGVSGQALLTSCIMSIPCSLAVSKLRMPEEEESITANEVRVPPSDEKPANVLHAAGSGAATGMNIALLMCANLISLLGLLYAVNAGLTWLGNFLTIHELTLQLITGYIFVPVAWIMGVDTKDVVIVGQILATKIWANEFVAYEALTTQYKNILSYRSHVITTYAVCGFANLGSVGMQIGVLSTLAPKRSGDIARLAVSAMLCGAVCTWVSATIAGMLL